MKTTIWMLYFFLDLNKENQMAGIKPLGLDKIHIGGIGQELNCRYYHYPLLLMDSHEFRSLHRESIFSFSMVG